VIKKVSIEKLRGIASGSLDDLAAVNVIVGPNNSGKSTILDALLLGASRFPEKMVHEVVARRMLADPSAWILHRSKGERAGQGLVEVNTDDGYERRVTITSNHERKENATLSARIIWPEEKRYADISREIGELSEKIRSNTTVFPTPELKNRQRKLAEEQKQLSGILRLRGNDQQREPIPGTPEVRLIESELSRNRTPVHDLYTRVAERGLKTEAKQIITDLVPEIGDIEILTQKGQPVVYLDHPGGALPLETAGDGVRLLFVLSLELASPEGGLVLLEEPETHLHPAAILQAARAIRAAARRGIQIALTTHSLDLIDSLLHAFGDDLDSLAFFRVKLDHGTLVSHRLAGSSAADARTRIAEDLR
jgi:energy-coupling factor transporter ATP-binding protein EcfA2